MEWICHGACAESVWNSLCLPGCADSHPVPIKRRITLLNILYVLQVHTCFSGACICAMIHVNFSVFLCILRYIAGECWLRDMDLAHWVCELWLNPWVYCFRHALTTSPQWPGSRLHSSQGGPLLTHSHPLLPLPLSLLFSPDPLSAPPAPSFTPPSHSTSHFSQLPSISPFMLCFFFFFYNPSCFPFSLRSYHTVVHRIETACWHLAETGPAVLPMETIWRTNIREL